MVSKNYFYLIIITNIWLHSYMVSSNTKNFNWAIGLMSRVFANGPGDQGSIRGRVISKTQKMVLDTSLLNIQHHKVWIKGKVERSNALLYTSV